MTVVKMWNYFKSVHTGWFKFFTGNIMANYSLINLYITTVQEKFSYLKSSNKAIVKEGEELKGRRVKQGTRDPKTVKKCSAHFIVHMSLCCLIELML